MPCPRLEENAIFWFAEMSQGHDHICFSSGSTPEASRKLYENLFLFWRTPEFLQKFAICLGEDLFFSTPEFLRKFAMFLREDLFFFGKHLRVVSLVLGLEHSRLWLREGVSSESQSLATDFLCSWPQALCPQLHLWSMATFRLNRSLFRRHAVFLGSHYGINKQTTVAARDLKMWGCCI